MDLEIKAINIITAYPWSKLYAEVYARPTELLKLYLGISGSDRVLRLKNTLYRLKQSGREWYIEVYRGLKSLGFEPLFSESSVFKNQGTM